MTITLNFCSDIKTMLLSLSCFDHVQTLISIQCLAWITELMYSRQYSKKARIITFNLEFRVVTLGLQEHEETQINQHPTQP